MHESERVLDVLQFIQPNTVEIGKIQNERCNLNLVKGNAAASRSLSDAREKVGQWDGATWP